MIKNIVTVLLFCGVAHSCGFHAACMSCVYTGDRILNHQTCGNYRLIVSGGLDKEGRQIKRRKLWIPPNRNLTDQQMLKEATAAAYKFEEQIKTGYMLDNTQTFSEYAQYVLELKERIGVKTSTLDRYIDMLPRILEAIGNLKLCNIRPQHLNDFYRDMTENAIREDSCRAVAKRNLA